MTPRVLDATTVVALLGEIAAERPDYVYRPGKDGGYLYVDGVGDDARPGCIVGHVFHRFGISLDYLSSCEGYFPDHITDGLYEITLTHAAGDVLITAMARQDHGRAWGYVADIAEAELVVAEARDRLAAARNQLAAARNQLADTSEAEMAVADAKAQLTVADDRLTAAGRWSQ
jgi:hypothetical protein